MKNLFSALFVISLMLTGCAVKTNPGMTMTQLNNAAVLSGNGNLVLVSRAGDFEIYQSSAVLDWKRQISQGNAVAKSILTPDKNVYYVMKGGLLQQEIVGDAGINSFIAKAQPPVKQASTAGNDNPPSTKMDCLFKTQVTSSGEIKFLKDQKIYKVSLSGNQINFIAPNSNPLVGSLTKKTVGPAATGYVYNTSNSGPEIQINFENKGTLAILQTTPASTTMGTCSKT
ncbi:hypothetical protein G6672_02760 [Polynucleobacter paneuropaeus]|nr:hypothetical protein [Polynucleobacter paneuropaeus]